jgi:Fe-S-cluster containining protein
VHFNYPKNIHYECQKCGLCCGDTKTHKRHILLLTKEAQQISKTLSKPTKTFAKKTKKHLPYAYEMKKTKKEGKCVFLKNNLCTIYPQRPLICRFYPFELKQTENSNTHTFIPTTECIGINRGPKLRKNHFQNLYTQAQNQLTKKEQTPQFTPVSQLS